MRRHVPPRVATWLVGRFLPEGDREAVIGDLVEEYAVRARSETRSTASRWYWGQVCRSIPRMLWCSFRAGHWLRTIGVALAAYIAASTLEFVGTAAIATMLGPDARLFTVVSLVFGLATIVLGGYIAASIRPGAAAALAVIVTITVVLLMLTRSDSAPHWYALVFLIVGPLAALAGGALCRNRRTGGAGRPM